MKFQLYKAKTSVNVRQEVIYKFLDYNFIKELYDANSEYKCFLTYEECEFFNSILNGMPIGAMTITVNSDGSKYSVIDGCKRLISLYKYIRDNSEDILYSPNTHSFYKREHAEGEKNPYMLFYPIHKVYDTYELILILDEIGKNERLSLQDKQIAIENLKIANRDLQQLIITYFEIYTDDSTCVDYYKDILDSFK